MQRIHVESNNFLILIDCHYLFQIKTLSKDVPNEKNAKIDVQAMRDYQSHLYDSLTEGWMVAKAIDTLKLQQSFLSKYVPAERLNGWFNLYFALSYPNATTGEIDSALVNMRHKTSN